MRRVTKVCIVLLIVFSLAAVSWADIAADRKAGECKLQKAQFMENAKHVIVKLGKALEVDSHFFYGDLMEKTHLMVSTSVKNPTEKPLFCTIHVAFFDKDGGLVGCVNKGLVDDEEGLAAGKSEDLAIGLIELPEAVIKIITRYQIVVYQSDKPIGKS